MKAGVKVISVPFPFPYRIMVLRKLPYGRGSIFICLIIDPFIDTAKKIVAVMILSYWFSSIRIKRRLPTLFMSLTYLFSLVSFIYTTNDILS